MNNKQAAFAIARKILPEILILAAAILLMVFVLSIPPALAEAAVWTEEEARLWDAYMHGEVIRLHVLADNDCENAQRIKLAVRDALLSAFGEQLKTAGASNSDAVFELLSSHEEDMRGVAQRCAKQNGFDGTVSAHVGLLTLPAKSYGSITLPKGEYRGLRVTLGSGEGQNWWCVLFPQLCLAAAGDEPWQVAPQTTNVPNLPKSEEQALSAQQSSSQEGTAAVVWEAKRILHCWTALPIAY
ncbi:MAG: stage II sporulation protein R [Clostridia bacterium]